MDMSAGSADGARVLVAGRHSQDDGTPALRAETNHGASRNNKGMTV
jgi:hypothetical protein